MSILTMITINKIVIHLIQKDQISEIMLANNKKKIWDIAVQIKIKIIILNFCQNMLRKFWKIMLATMKTFIQIIDIWKSQDLHCPQKWKNSEIVGLKEIILTNNYRIRNLILKQDPCPDKAELTIIKVKVQETIMNLKKTISLIHHRY